MLSLRFSSSIGSVGIDISSRTVKLLQVRLHDGGLKVVGAGEELWRDAEEPVTPEVLATRIRSAVSSGGFTGRRCIVCLPRTEVHVQSVRLPKMPDEELRQAAVWEASQRFGLDPNTSQVDVIRTGASIQGTESRDEVLLIAATHENLNTRLQPILDAGLRPVAVDTDFAALARFFSRKYRRESDHDIVRAVIDVGASGSTVLVLRGDQIAFCKPLTISGAQFDQAVTEHLQIEPAAAAELRAARIAHAGQSDGNAADSPIDTATDRAVFEAVRPLMGELVKEVTLCLRYYGVTFRGRPPKQIILSGGDGLEPRLDEILNNGCKIPVVHDDEQETLQSLIGQIQTTLNRTPGPATRWAVAAGLSCRDLFRKAPLEEATTESSTEGAVAA